VPIYIYQHKSSSFVKLDLRVRSQDADKPIVYDIQKLGLSASRQEFEWKSNNKRMTTVENYYKEHYNLTLK